LGGAEGSGGNKRSREFQILDLKFLGYRRFFFYIGERQQLARAAIEPDDNHILAGASLFEKFIEVFLGVG
jgi:hypothetical protein